DGSASGAPLGRGVRSGGRPLRTPADLRPGLRGPAPERARFLPRRPAREARPGEADRVPHADVRHAGAHGEGWPASRPALGAGACVARLFGRRARQSRRGGSDTGDTMSEDEILFQVQVGGIALLAFTRPEARKAMTFGMYRRLGEICRSPDPRMKVLILRGA